MQLPSPQEQDPFAAQFAYEYELAQLRKKYAPSLGAHAAQSGIYIAESAKSTAEGEEEFQERLENEDRKHKLQAAANGAFIINTFEAIDAAQEFCTFGPGFKGISDYTPHFNSPDAWLAHHSHTSFIMPPGDGQYGRIEKRRRFAPNIYKPMPVWVIGEQLDGKEWEYLMVTTRSHSGQIYVEDPLSPSFQLFKARAEARLPEPEPYVPTQAELEAAYDTSHKTLRFETTLPAEKAGKCPKMKTMEMITGVSDLDMQGFSVAERLMKLPSAYEVPPETTETHLAAYHLLRQQISNWDGSFSPDALRNAFADLPQKTFLPLFFKMGVRLPAEMYGYPDDASRSMAISVDRRHGYYHDGVITFYS